MIRILYGSPQADDPLVAKLSKEHEVTHHTEWLPFHLDLWYCKDRKIGPKIIEARYDIIYYDTRLYGENWLPQVRAENFKFGVLRCFERIEVPVRFLVDDEIYESVENALKNFQRRKEKQQTPISDRT